MNQEERRQIIRSRGGKCENCGIAVNIATAEIHHLDGDKKNDRLSNLKVLCKKRCHKIVTKTQAKTRAADRRRRQRSWL